MSLHAACVRHPRCGDDNRRGRGHRHRLRHLGRAAHPLPARETDPAAYRQRPAEQGDSATPLDKHPHRQPPPPADPRQAAR